MSPIPMDAAAFGIYQLLWSSLIPFLKYNQRLAEGYEQRRLKHPHLEKADVWIQSASAGEAYLSWEILKRLAKKTPIKVLATTNTGQGKQILDRAKLEISQGDFDIKIQTAYFPFDSPLVMSKAVGLVKPRLTVLLETELWPGLLRCLRQSDRRVLVINGRMTKQSLDRYMIWPSFWRKYRPDSVLAISTKDRKHFATLFGDDGVSDMPNIKFDRLVNDDLFSDTRPDLDRWLPPGKKFLVLGSVREAEEKDVRNIIHRVLSQHPNTVVGLFPRHMHRMAYWRQTLQEIGFDWAHRSSNQRLKTGGVILWDVFGELSLAYSVANAAFVGGSLVELGGQNFLEPLVRGVPTVMGPFWDNFKWVGSEILDLGILCQADSWKEVADFLSARIIKDSDKNAIQKKAQAYIRARQGGTDMACERIRTYLQE